MPAQDTLTHAAAASAGTAPEAPTENVFNQVFANLGNHHEIDFMPIGKVPLPYIFVDQGNLHVFSGMESLKESGIYTVNTDPRVDKLQTVEASPIAEKGSVARLD